MPQLKVLQKYFKEAIFENNIVNLSNSIKLNNIGKEEIINIYKNNVITTLCETLRNRYPAILNLTGEDFFKYAILKFIKENQPKSGNLDDYGEEFIGFIENLKEAQNYKYLKDIARLEWAIHTAYFTENASKVDIEALSKITTNQLQNCYFTLHPTAHLIESSYAIDKIYMIANQLIHNDTNNININKPTYILVIRAEYKIDFLTLEIGEYYFLKSIGQKSKMLDAFEAASNVDKRFDFAKALNKFSLNGTFSNFIIS